MRFAYPLALAALFFAPTIVHAEDCAAQYSMCLTAEANYPTSNGTEACLSQRTACVAALEGTPGALNPGVPDPGIIVVPPVIRQTPTTHPRREQREQFRSLVRAQAAERQNLWAKQREERDAFNWKEFDCILRAPASEPKGSRMDRRELGEKWTPWY